MGGRRFHRVFLAFSLVVVLLWGSGAFAKTVMTYDDFSSDTISSSLWSPIDNGHGFFSVVDNSGTFNGGQAYMLQVVGSGGATHPGGYIQTSSSPFGTSFGAAIDFANFSYTGSTPQSGGNSKSPSVSIQIGDFGGTNPYFTVSRAYSGTDGNIISWREYSGDGSTVQGKGYVNYTGDVGGLVVTAINEGGSNWSVNLGYFNSGDPTTYGSASLNSLLLTPFLTTFSGDPLIRIGANGGSRPMAASSPTWAACTTRTSTPPQFRARSFFSPPASWVLRPSGEDSKSRCYSLHIRGRVSKWPCLSYLFASSNLAAPRRQSDTPLQEGASRYSIWSDLEDCTPRARISPNMNYSH